MTVSPIVRSIEVFLLIAFLAIVAWTFKVKNESQTALDRVTELQRQIEAEKTEIDLLKSDWSLLTSPSRLQELVSRYEQQLKLQQTDASQIADESTLPAFRQKTITGEPEFRNADHIDIENVVTGSIPVPEVRRER